MKKFEKKDNTKEIKVGPSESMSKSKKNTIDPQIMIDNYLSLIHISEPTRPERIG